MLLRAGHHRSGTGGVQRDAWGRWSGQFDVEFVEQQFGVGVGLGVSGQDQPALIHGGNTDVDHLNRCELFHYRSGCESGSMSQETVLESDLKTVGQKGNQDVRIGSMFELMMDRADAQFALEGTEHGFDLGQLHVASPKDWGVFSREIGAQQVVSITQMGGLEFGFIDVESKRLPGHGLSGVGHLDADKTKRTARLGFRRADTHEQLVA